MSSFLTFAVLNSCNADDGQEACLLFAKHEVSIDFLSEFEY